MSARRLRFAPRDVWQPSIYSRDRDDDFLDASERGAAVLSGACIVILDDCYGPAVSSPGGNSDA